MVPPPGESEEVHPPDGRELSTTEEIFHSSSSPQAHFKVKVNPELEKFRKLCEPPAHPEPFCTLKRRRWFNSWSESFFGATIIVGVVLTFISFTWHAYFSFNYVKYSIPRLRNASQEAQNVSLTFPFISQIKAGNHAYDCYLFAACFTIAGALFALNAEFHLYRYRPFVYLGSIVIYLCAIALFLAALLPPLLAENTQHEKEVLDTDEVQAQQSEIKGSLGYYRDQCKSENSDDPEVEKRAHDMAAFCTLVVHLTKVLLVSFCSILVPFVGVIVCILQILVNKEHWGVRVVNYSKHRTAERIEEDKCTFD